jgi:hypothetical protein
MAVTPAARPSPAIVIIPAIFLLIIGIFALLADLADILLTMNPNLMPVPKLGPEWRELKEKLEEAQQQKQDSALFYILFSGLFAVGALIIIVGSIQMMRRRMWGLALAGSIVAMLHINSGCCVCGIPMGLWALIILCLPHVRAMFE